MMAFSMFLSLMVLGSLLDSLKMQKNASPALRT